MDLSYFYNHMCKEVQHEKGSAVTIIKFKDDSAAALMLNKAEEYGIHITVFRTVGDELTLRIESNEAIYNYILESLQYVDERSLTREVQKAICGFIDETFDEIYDRKFRNKI